MKTSTMFVRLTLGAASLNGAVILPASADDNTPTKNGTGNCSTARDQAPNKRCVTKTPDGKQDKYAEERTKIGIKYGNGSVGQNGKVSPFGAGRTAPPISDMKNDGRTTVWFSTPGGGTGVKSIYLGPGGTFGYYGSSAGCIRRHCKVAKVVAAESSSRSHLTIR